jgi:hypothetical protein
VVAPGLEAAVAAQTIAPATVRVTRDVLRDGAALARRSDADWLWLLDGSAVPRADALERLLGDLPRLPRLDNSERLHDLATRSAEPPPPALVTGMVLDLDGGVASGLTAWYRREAAAVAVEAAGLRALPLRAAPLASVLVRREAAAAAPPPRLAAPGIAAAVAWTAGVLRDAPGFLVTTSVATAVEPSAWPREALSGDPADDLGGALALACSPGLGARDRFRTASDAALRARAAARAGHASPPRLLRAAAAGGAAGLRARRAA